MNAIQEKFREALHSEKGVLGLFMKATDPMFIEAAGAAGFDFAIIDMEHGPVDIGEAQNLIRAAGCAGICPIVRVPFSDGHTVGSALDIGAAGIQAPNITCAAEAGQVVEAAKFSPAGQRGLCRFVRAADYSSMDRLDYIRGANESLVILQLEGVEAIANLDEILMVPHVDVLFIGPYDLSQSLGLPGQVEHPLVEKHMQEIYQRCAARGVIVGAFADNHAMARKWRAAGIRYLAYSVDVGIFSEACGQLVTAFR